MFQGPQEAITNNGDLQEYNQKMASYDPQIQNMQILGVPAEAIEAMRAAQGSAAKSIHTQCQKTLALVAQLQGADGGAKPAGAAGGGGKKRKANKSSHSSS